MPGDAEYGLLGPLLVRRAGAPIGIPAGKQRILLAALLLRAGRLSGLDELVETLWGQAPPVSARQSLHNYVARLRQALRHGPDQLIITEPGGYRIVVGHDELDVARFEAALAAGRAAAQDGSWTQAAELLAGGLALWRGEPLSGIDSEVLAAREVPRLTELRLQALELRIQADLQLGRHRDVIGELRRLVAEQPLRERLHALLMTALDRDGQQAQALSAYQAARRSLISELGAEPGPELRRLHQQVLAGGQAPAGLGRPPPPAVRFSLPPGTAAFTGRGGELDRITAAAAQAGRDGGAMAIIAIAGMPGIGKTALAIHAARLLADQFPDRQLFVDLHAHTPGQDPVPAGAALAGLLAASGVNPRYLPGDLDGRMALWRNHMAGQRAVLVLDNAASSTQVIPLLPGGRGCVVLVTSRRHLGDLPGTATPLPLEELPAGHAQDMLIRLAPRAAAGPAAAVRELAELAGRLPLALSLLARVYNRHPSWSLADLITETRARLLTLTGENDSIATALEVSWEYLDRVQQEFFRSLGLHPGTTADAYGAAALAGVPLPEAARRLDELHGEGLLTEIGYRRYGMHDLIRRYAQDRAQGAPAEDRAAAVRRLLDYYQHTAAEAESVLTRQSRASPASAVRVPPAAVPELPDDVRALAWARAERDSLLACLDYAAAAGQGARVVALTAALAELLRRDGPWPEAAARHARAAEAARLLGDQASQAGALGQLGEARRLAADYPGAVSALTEALAMYRHLGDRLGQANALSSLGETRRMTGDCLGAAEVLDQALARYRDLGDQPGLAGTLRCLGEIRRMTGDYPGAARVLDEALHVSQNLGDRLGQATTLLYLGTVRRETGDYPGAARVLDEALQLSQDLGDRLGEANVLLFLGDIRRLTGNYRDAAAALDEALAAYRDLGSRNGRAFALNYLGVVRRETGDYRGAADALDEALIMLRDLGDRLGQANTLLRLGDVHRETGNYPEAVQILEEALAIYRAPRNPSGQAYALRYLGAVLRESGEHRAAADTLQEALRLFRELGDRSGRVDALNEIGALSRARGDLSHARDSHRQALHLAREIASPLAEARALAGLGRCALAAGDAGAAVHLGLALEIFERIGAAAAAADVAVELSALAPAPGADGGPDAVS